MSTPTRLAPTRRTVLRTAAWTAPAVSIAVAAPAFAMSGTSGNASGTAGRNGKNVTVAATFTNTGVAHSGMYLTVSLPDNTFVSGGAASGWGLGGVALDRVDPRERVGQLHRGGARAGTVALRSEINLDNTSFDSVEITVTVIWAGNEQGTTTAATYVKNNSLP